MDQQILNLITPSFCLQWCLYILAGPPSHQQAELCIWPLPDLWQNIQTVNKLDKLQSGICKAEDDRNQRKNSLRLSHNFTQLLCISTGITKVLFEGSNRHSLYTLVSHGISVISSPSSCHHSHNISHHWPTLPFQDQLSIGTQNFHHQLLLDCCHQKAWCIFILLFCSSFYPQAS